MFRRSCLLSNNCLLSNKSDTDQNGNINDCKKVNDNYSNNNCDNGFNDRELNSYLAILFCWIDHGHPTAIFLHLRPSWFFSFLFSLVAYRRGMFTGSTLRIWTSQKRRLLLQRKGIRERNQYYNLRLWRRRFWMVSHKRSAEFDSIWVQVKGLYCLLFREFFSGWQIFLADEGLSPKYSKLSYHLMDTTHFTL